MAALCGSHAIRLLCYGTVAGGFLSERWLGRPEPPDMLANRSLTKYKLVIDEFGGWDLFQELLTCLSDVARKHRVLPATVAIRWVLERPEVAAAIVGARSAEHLATTMEVFSLALDADDLLAPRRGAGASVGSGGRYLRARARSGRAACPDHAL